MDELSVRIGKKLLALRKQKGLTQSDVATHLNKSFYAYSNYETGKRIIGIEDLIVISNLYGVSIDEIVGNKKSTTSYKTYGANESIDINIYNKDIILFRINDFETEYFIKTSDIIFNEKVLVQLDGSAFPGLISRSENPSGYLVTNLLTKEAKFFNNTAFKNTVVILGRYAGKINKELNIPDFF